jgi:hypothetical protein
MVGSFMDADRDGAGIGGIALSTRRVRDLGGTGRGAGDFSSIDTDDLPSFPCIKSRGTLIIYV